jgi:phosphate transport system substrate-binding protein
MFMQHKSMNLVRYVSLAILVASLSACASGEQPTSSPGSSTDKPAANLEGKIAIDGSSTVFPITEAMAEEFQKANSKVQVTVGVSGTGGGFKKFCAGETDISNASRPIKEEEAKACKNKNIEFIELPIAFDALSVVAHPENTWAECMKVEELKKIWEPGAQGKITKWKQINPAYPDEALALYGPGTDSGTFDYFTDAIVGEEGKSRGDFTASEDDNTLVQGVEGNKYALGYFGYAYYEENKEKLKAVAIDDGDPSNGEGCVQPSSETVLDSTYQPLARPIFIYVSKTALQRPEVKGFVEFYLAPDNHQFVKEVGYFPLTDAIYTKALARVTEGKTGSAFPGGSTVGVKLEEVL